MDIFQKKILVVGTGVSGLGAVKLLLEKEAVPVLFEPNASADKEKLLAKVKEAGDVVLYIGELPAEEKEDIVMVVLSPGISPEKPFVAEFIQRKIPVLGEFELAWRFEKGKVAAITGTNGKTTTTTLVGNILRSWYEKTFVVGNIGDPYACEVLNTTEDSVTVAEVSSFQLETADTFAPAVAAVTNITPDHLDRHHTMENYVSMKKRIFERQTPSDVCVLNYEDSYTPELAKACPSKIVYFSSKRELEEGIYYHDGSVYLAENGKKEFLLCREDIKLAGDCNVENVMEAIAVGKAMGVPMDRILETVKAFEGVEHRIEYVATKGGVDYYNDSKGTNPDAAIWGIRAMTKKTVLIAGGYDKQVAFDDWVEAFEDKVKTLIVMGNTKEKIAACARAHGFENIVMAETYEEAFLLSAELAEPGEAVLLSPACASFDMFPNYEIRGKKFKEFVAKIGV